MRIAQTKIFDIAKPIDLQLRGQLFRFLGIGLILTCFGAAIQVVLLTAGSSVAVASFVPWLATVGPGYWLHRTYTFDFQSISLVTGFTTFILISVARLVLNIALVYLFFELLKLNAVAAAGSAVTAGSLAQFFTLKRFECWCLATGK